MTKLDGKNILVVDDEPDLLDVTTDMLGLDGAKVVRAVGATEARALLAKGSFDAIVSDVRMHFGSGLDLLHHVVRGPHPRPPVVLMTGFSDLELAEAYALGAGAILPKPCEYSRLKDTVMRLLTPPARRWLLGEPGNPKDTIVARLPDFAQVCQERLLTFGTGGFFLPLPQDHARPAPELNFDLNFASGPIKQLKGRGITRWSRARDREDLRAGAGIEITWLADNCRPAFLEYLEREHPTAYLPRT